MKTAFINKSINFLSKYNNYSEEDKEKILYGLEGIYLTLTKLIIIFLLSFILGMIKEVLILLLLFNVIRYFGFGIHARKSIECLISSTLMFIVLPYIFLKLSLDKNVLLIISSISLISLIFFAPADTPKRPFYNKKKIMLRKIITLLIGITYLILSLIIKDNTFIILLQLSILLEAIAVNPITYMIMRQTYNSGKNGEKVS